MVYHFIGIAENLCKSSQCQTLVYQFETQKPSVTLIGNSSDEQPRSTICLFLWVWKYQNPGGNFLCWKSFNLCCIKKNIYPCHLQCFNWSSMYTIIVDDYVCKKSLFYEEDILYIGQLIYLFLSTGEPVGLC